MLSWPLLHPWLSLAILLGMESLLPVRFQPTCWAIRGAIRVYQAALSPFVPSRCPYHPTCSHYGLASFQRHGTLKGVLLTTWRILRCHPFTRGGADYPPGTSACDFDH